MGNLWASITLGKILVQNYIISEFGEASYQMRLSVTPQFKTTPHYEYFTIVTKLCEVESLTVANPVPSVYNYQIKSSPDSVEIPLPFISAEPSCNNGFLGLGLDYKL